MMTNLPLDLSVLPPSLAGAPAPVASGGGFAEALAGLLQGAAPGALTAIAPRTGPATPPRPRQELAATGKTAPVVDGALALAEAEDSSGQSATATPTPGMVAVPANAPALAPVVMAAAGRADEAGGTTLAVSDGGSDRPPAPAALDAEVPDEPSFDPTVAWLILPSTPPPVSAPVSAPPSTAVVTIRSVIPDQCGDAPGDLPPQVLPATASLESGSRADEHLKPVATEAAIAQPAVPSVTQSVATGLRATTAGLPPLARQPAPMPPLADTTGQRADPRPATAASASAADVPSPTRQGLRSVAPGIEQFADLAGGALVAPVLRSVPSGLYPRVSAGPVEVRTDPSAVTAVTVEPDRPTIPIARPFAHAAHEATADPVSTPVPTSAPATTAPLTATPIAQTAAQPSGHVVADGKISAPLPELEPIAAGTLSQAARPTAFRSRETATPIAAEPLDIAFVRSVPTSRRDDAGVVAQTSVVLAATIAPAATPLTPPVTRLAPDSAAIAGAEVGFVAGEPGSDAGALDVGSAPMLATALPAPATALATTPAIDLTGDPGVHRMIDHIERLRDAADAADTRIRLIPDALGPVEVAVKREGEGVAVHFTAAEPAARQLLAEATPRLTELAEARGVRIDRATVDSAGQSAGQSSGQGAGDGPPRQPQPAAPAPTRGLRRDPSESGADADHRIA